MYNSAPIPRHQFSAVLPVFLARIWRHQATCKQYANGKCLFWKLVQCSECIHLQIYTWRGRISVTAGEDASFASSEYSDQNIVKHYLHVCSAGDHEQREVTRDWCRVSGAGRRGIYPMSHKLSRHCHAVSRYVTLHSLLSAAVSAF